MNTEKLRAELTATNNQDQSPVRVIPEGDVHANAPHVVPMLHDCDHSGERGTDWAHAPDWAVAHGYKVATGEWCWLGGTAPVGFRYIQLRPTRFVRAPHESA